MQRAGNVGRRDDHGIGRGLGALRPAGTEGAGSLPSRVNPALNFGRLVSVFDHCRTAFVRVRKPVPSRVSTPGAASAGRIRGLIPCLFATAPNPRDVTRDAQEPNPRPPPTT